MSTNTCVFSKSTKQYRRRKPQYTPMRSLRERMIEDSARNMDT